MRSTLRTLLLLALLLPVSGVVEAQRRGLRPVEREHRSESRDFWVLAGLAHGVERYRFDIDDSWSDEFRANSFTLAAGGMVGQDVALGVEWNVWSDYEADSDQRLHALSLVGHMYLLGSPLYVKGGLGFGFNRIDDIDGEFRDSGVGVTVGAGIDVPIARRVALQPRIDYYAQRYDDSGQDNDYEERLVQVGVAVRLR
jgi:hypothetical protein